MDELRKRMNLPAIFYLPLLHEGCAPAYLPAEVSFIPASTRAPSTDGGRKKTPAAAAAEAAFFASYPLAPTEAKATLAEISALGTAYAGRQGQGVSLLQTLISAALLPSESTTAVEEASDLQAFVNSGGRMVGTAGNAACAGFAGKYEQVAGADAVRKALIDCQKTLLLAYELEEHLAEVRALETKTAQSEADLYAGLRAGDGEDSIERLHAVYSGACRPKTEQDEEKELAARKPASAADAESADLANAGQAVIPNPESTAGGGVSWKIIMEAALPFMPSDAVFFSADPQTATDLKEAGMLQPLPEDWAAVFTRLTPNLASELLFAELPAWRATGRREPPADRPWTARDLTIFVPRPHSPLYAVPAPTGKNDPSSVRRPL